MYKTQIDANANLKGKAKKRRKREQSGTSRFMRIVKRKVQGVPQSQSAANPRHQEEDTKTKRNACKCTRSILTSSFFPK